MLKRLLQDLAPRSPDPGTIVSLQALRFFAALFVLVSHTGDSLERFIERYGVNLITFPEKLGHFGVEVFFVISGYIMAHVGWNSFGGWQGAWLFLRKRIARIVPLYWALTLAQALFVVVAPKEHFAASELFKSLFFIPYLNEAGKHRPMLGQGWTLNFEMFFYGIFTLGLLAPRKVGLIAIMTVLGAAAAASLLMPQGPILLDPILFFFLAGLVLGVLRRVLGRTPPSVPGVVPGCLLLLLAAAVIDQEWAYTLIAISTVALCVFTHDARHDSSLNRILTALGDSSYSLYLSHTFVLLVVTMLWRRVFGASLLELYFAIVVIGSLAAAWACYCWFEKPAGKQASRMLGIDSASGPSAPRVATVRAESGAS